MCVEAFVLLTGGCLTEHTSVLLNQSLCVIMLPQCFSSLVTDPLVNCVVWWYVCIIVICLSVCVGVFLMCRPEVLCELCLLLFSDIAFNGNIVC